MMTLARRATTSEANALTGLVPRRLMPGWEGPLPIRSVAGGFVGMGYRNDLADLLSEGDYVAIAT